MNYPPEHRPHNWCHSLLSIPSDFQRYSTSSKASAIWNTSLYSCAEPISHNRRRKPTWDPPSTHIDTRIVGRTVGTGGATSVACFTCRTKQSLYNRQGSHSILNMREEGHVRMSLVAIPCCMEKGDHIRKAVIDISCYPIPYRGGWPYQEDPCRYCMTFHTAWERVAISGRPSWVSHPHTVHLYLHALSPTVDTMQPLLSNPSLVLSCPYYNASVS